MPVLRHAPLVFLTLALAFAAGPATRAQTAGDEPLRAGLDVAAAPDDPVVDPLDALLLRTDQPTDGIVPLDPATGEPAVTTADDTVAGDQAVIADDAAQPVPAAASQTAEESGAPDLFDPPPPGLEGVTARQRTELEPLGLRVGSFTVHTDVEAAVETTDNVLESSRQRRSDTLYVVRPQATVRSDWNRHALGVAYSGAYGSYAENPSQDPRTTRISADGRLDISHATALALRAGFAMDQEGPGDVDVPEGAGQTRFRTGEVGGEISHRINRLRGALRGALAVSDYDDSHDALGAVVNNDDRDLTETGAGLRLSYDLTPATAVFADAYWAWGRHRQRRDDLGFARDSLRRTLVAGATWRPSRLVELEASAGQVHEDFEDGRLVPVDEATANARLAWAVTPLTTLSAELATDVGTTTLAGASAAVGRTVRGGIDHELLRNLILHGSASLNRTDYSGIELEEETVAAEASAEYWITRGVALVGRYRRSDKSSNEPGSADIVENVASLGVRLQH